MDTLAVMLKVLREGKLAGQDLAMHVAVLADLLEETGDKRAEQVRRERAEPAPLNMPHHQVLEILGALLNIGVGYLDSELLSGFINQGYRFFFTDPRAKTLRWHIPHPCPGLPTRADASLAARSDLYQMVAITMVEYGYMAPELSNPRRFREVPTATLRHERYYVGLCRQCRLVVWSWDQWPRPVDILAGKNMLRGRICAMFPEHHPNWQNPLGDIAKSMRELNDRMASQPYSFPS